MQRNNGHRALHFLEPKKHTHTQQEFSQTNASNAFECLLVSSCLPSQARIPYTRKRHGRQPRGPAASCQVPIRRSGDSESGSASENVSIKEWQCHEAPPRFSWAKDLAHAEPRCLAATMWRSFCSFENHGQLKWLFCSLRRDASFTLGVPDLGCPLYNSDHPADRWDGFAPHSRRQRTVNAEVCQADVKPMSEW